MINVFRVMENQPPMTGNIVTIPPIRMVMTGGGLISVLPCFTHIRDVFFLLNVN